jgi:hypothetical protein
MTKFRLAMRVFQALLDDFTHEAELLSRHYQDVLDKSLADFS